MASRTVVLWNKLSAYCIIDMSSLMLLKSPAVLSQKCLLMRGGDPISERFMCAQLISV